MFLDIGEGVATRACYLALVEVSTRSTTWSTRGRGFPSAAGGRGSLDVDRLCAKDECSVLERLEETEWDWRRPQLYSLSTRGAE